MVSIAKKNAFELREHIAGKVLRGASADPFKACFVRHLGLTDRLILEFDFEMLSLYQKSIVSGLGVIDETISSADLSRLLGQASRIDATPMPWVSDPIGVMSIKWLSDQDNDENMKERFQSWTVDFVSQQICSDRLSVFECDIAKYLQDASSSVFTTATIPLFLHYRGSLILGDQKVRQELIGKFMSEFVEHGANSASTLVLALMAYCFDHANEDIALVPPHGWSLEDLVVFLNRIPVGLKRWTWEEKKGRTRNSAPIKWPVENEYHVQNLLYTLLAPVFDDIADEINLQQVGQRSPRADLYLPSLNTIIEVKYRKNKKKSFSKLMGEIAEDASLYHADQRYVDAPLICFLWDHTRSTQEHAKFKEGALSIQGIEGVVVVNSPSFM